MEIQTKSYHGSGNGQGDKKWQIGVAGCNLYYVAGFMICRKKSYPTFTQWSKGMGKAVIYKALHEGNVN